MNEPQFQGHFPDLPVMPGVLIIEHGASVRHTRHPQRRRPQRKRFFFFAGIDDARFKRQVIPGDQLVFEVELLTNKRGIGKFNAVAKVDGQVAVEAVIMCAKRVV